MARRHLALVRRATRDDRNPILPVGLLVLGLAVSLARPARAQISPGPLARAHTQLEGSLQCTKCHAGRREPMARQCLACHQEIEWLLERRRGYHAGVVNTPCATCHPDHAGDAFALIRWPGGAPERYDHRQTGWPLEGDHGKLQCTECHQTRFATSPGARLAPRPGGARWVGLEPACASCHEDVHRGALDQKCTSCHGYEGWKPAPGFDHARTDYPLTGRHQSVSCGQCHVPAMADPPGSKRSAGPPVYRPVPHAECSSCHSDPHAGRLGPACRDCHTTGGFRTVSRDRFDHGRTRYPLLGRHATVACAGCHDFNTPRGTRPAFGTCAGCHRDVHAGTATLAGRPVDCGACHQVNGFTPARLTLEQHRATRFALEGKHQTVRCDACHTRGTGGTALASNGPSRVVMRPAFAECRSCHADDHGGQLSARSDLANGACESCHRVAGWRPSTYTGDRHATLRLPLEGRHAEIACRACHGTDRIGLPPTTATGVGQAGLLLQLKETDCVHCHVDPHGGRFAPGGERRQPDGCRSCHDIKSFRPSTIDVAAHARYGFQLEGAHGAVPCAGCHADIKTTRRASSLVAARERNPGGLPLALKRRDCEACHTNPHGEQFRNRAGGETCERCHGVQGFTPASGFDHDRDALFPLKGGHAGLACARCHQSRPVPSGRPQMVYRPLSGKCESCHGDARTRATGAR